jgi:uncharacterized protein (TIGR03905 family)
MTKNITYRPTGVCSVQYDIVLEDDVIADIKIYGGCDGNLKGISSLLKGMKAQDAIERMSGIRCRTKATSCPDQIAKALQEALAE